MCPPASRGDWIGSRGACTPSIGTPTTRSAVATRARCLRWGRLGSARDAPCWPLAWWSAFRRAAWCLHFLSPTWPWWPWRRLAWALAVFLGPGLRPLGKLGTRFLPAAAAAFLAVQGLRVRQPWGLALVATIAVAVPLIVRAYSRRGPHRAACEACPERDRRPCSGFRPQYRRERAFQRLAARMINLNT